MTSSSANTVENDSAASHGKAFGQTYWMLNSIEAFERLAYFGIRAVVPIYIMQATEPGGLHLTAVHKGWIYMWWAFFQSYLPMLTGGIADRYGYKRVLRYAILANVVGYLMMAYFHSYYGFFAGILVLATGTAFFKPALQGSIAQNLNKENASMGWGLFYWVVNIGAVAAPPLATVILGKPHSAQGWQDLFLASAAYTAMNLLLLFTFKDVPSGASKIESLWVTLWKTISNLWNIRLVSFLLIMSCFWMMMYQVWDLHPNFIEDWVDSSSITSYVPFDSWKEYGDRGLIRVPQQILLTLNAALIVLLVVPISYLVRRMRTLSAMLIGMTVATIGTLVAGLTFSGWILLLGIVFFSLGEMLTGPKKNQYLGLIAPPGKKGLYLGYVNIPVGVGVGLGSMIAGLVYDNYGEKATLALKHLGANTELVARAAQSADWSDTLEIIPRLTGIDRSEAFTLACRDLGQDTDTASETLRQAFRYDHGQITNLAILHLALENKDMKKLSGEFGEVLIAEAKTADEVEDESSAPAVELTKKDAKELTALAGELKEGKRTIADINAARFIHLLPDALGCSRVDALGLVAKQVRDGSEEMKESADSEIVDLLWEKHGADPGVLNNLALEYLAQKTNLVHDAAAKITFDDPVKEMEKLVGIGRTKSFNALSVALGSSSQEVDEALAKPNVWMGDTASSAYVYLANLIHLRFNAVGRKDWTTDVKTLQDMIEADPEAKKIATESMGGELNYAELSDQQEIIQEAFNVKDWSKNPEHAAYLLRLNPYEARSLVASEIKKSPQATTMLLWKTYNPQYNTWIPFAAIGVAAIIALAIFGHKAKKWADMNA